MCGAFFLKQLLKIIIENYVLVFTNKKYLALENQFRIYVVNRVKVKNPHKQ